MKEKNRLYNLILLIGIIIVLFAGMLFVLDTKGDLVSKSEKSHYLNITQKKGLVNIQRNHIAFSAENEMMIKDDDLIETSVGSTFKINNAASNIFVSSKSALKIVSANIDQPNLAMEKGLILVDQSQQSAFNIMLNQNTIISQNAIYTITKQVGSATINVLKGSVEYDNHLINELESLLILTDSYTLSNVEASHYDNDMLDILVTLDNIALSKNDIKDEQLKRDEALKKSNEALILDDEINFDENITNQKMVTIEISCHNILANIDKLNAGKDIFVPSNGVILAPSKIKINDGDTVFDVLKLVTEYASIQLEYAYFPIYESHYIEGINNLYEKECGDGSGWIYKVNGYKPNFGVSKYVLNDGDIISFEYTCDYGKDTE